MKRKLFPAIQKLWVAFIFWQEQVTEKKRHSRSGETVRTFWEKRGSKGALWRPSKESG